MDSGHHQRCVCVLNVSVRVQLAASLNNILNSDFPEQWPDFINELETFLTSDDIRAVHVGLVALREVVKVYQ